MCRIVLVWYSLQCCYILVDDWLMDRNTKKLDDVLQRPTHTMKYDDIDVIQRVEWKNNENRCLWSKCVDDRFTS